MYGNIFLEVIKQYSVHIGCECKLEVSLTLKRVVTQNCFGNTYKLLLACIAYSRFASKIDTHTTRASE